MPARERIITCEEVFELRLAHRDVVGLQCRQESLEGTGEIDLRRRCRAQRQRRLKRLQIRLEARKPAARAWLVTAMSIRHLSVDRTDRCRRQLDQDERRQASIAKRRAKSCHDRLPDLGPGGLQRFGVSLIRLHVRCP